MKEIHLFCGQWDGSGVGHLNGLRSNEIKLILKGVKFSAEGFSELVSIEKHFEYLGIQEAKIPRGSGEIMEHLSVSALDLSSADLGGDKLPPLLVGRLQGLNLNDCDLEVAPWLASMGDKEFPKMEHLWLRGMGIEDGGVAMVARSFPNLKSLVLSGNSLTEESYSDLNRLSSLEATDFVDYNLAVKRPSDPFYKDVFGYVLNSVNRIQCHF
ncbi:MAG: hypothetical protein AAF226_01740 [Verrucomicrobiota bacterium]